MTKDDKHEWETRTAAADAGYDPKAWRGLQIHGQNTLKHEYVKFALCWVLEEKGRDWDTEVQCDDGRVDVFDHGPTDGKPVVYEVETGVTQAQREAKVNQYRAGPVRDVIVIDPADVPSEIQPAVRYLREYEVV